MAGNQSPVGEVDKSELENLKLRAEIEKLTAETSRLRSETSPFGSIARLAWPLVSGIVSLVVSLVSLRIASQAGKAAADQEQNRNFYSALQIATDPKGGYEARIAGVWSLVAYWHDPRYSTVTANALSAIVATATDSTAAESVVRADQLRQAAADAIGQAITEQTPPAESERLRILLYGDARPGKGSPGTITRYQQSLTALKLSLARQNADTAEVERRLRATREAIRENWEDLRYAMFAGHDLSGIDLYGGQLNGAFLRDANLSFANLCGADLSQVTLNGADLRYADLAGANLAGSIGWPEVKSLSGANIAGVKNAPPDFLQAAQAFKAESLTKADWKAHLNSLGTLEIDRPSSVVYTKCEQYP